MDSSGMVAVIRGNNLGLSVILVNSAKLKKTNKCVGSDAKVDFEKSYKSTNNVHKSTSILSNRDISPKVNYNGYLNTFAHAKRSRTDAIFSTRNRNICYQRTIPGLSGSNKKAEQLFKNSLRKYSFDNKATCNELADVIATSKLKKLINANKPSPYAKVNIRAYRAKIRQNKLLHLLKNYNLPTGAQNDHSRSQNKQSERNYSDKSRDQFNDELRYSYDYFNVGKKNRLRKMQVYLSDDVGNTIKTNDHGNADKLIMCPALNKRYCKHLQLYHNKRTCAKQLCKAACQDPEPKNLLYKIAMNICCKCQKTLPCDCFPAKKTHKNFNSIIEDRVSEWADDVPVYMNESAEGKIKRRLLIHKLKETLTKLPKDYKFLELARSEIKEVVKTMPMWRPNNAQDRDNLINHLTTALVEKLVNLNAGLVGKIESVLKDVPFKDTDTQGRHIKKRKEIETPVQQIKVLIEEECNDENFKDILKSNLHGILNELPLDLSKEDIDKEEALGKITSKVANELNNIALEYKETKLAETMHKQRVQGSEVWVNPEEDSLDSYIFEERIIWDVIEKTPPIAQISRTQINDMVKKLADQLHPLGLDAKDKKSLTARVNSFLEKVSNKTQTQIKASVRNDFVENILQELEFKIPTLTPLSVEKLIWDVIEKTPELAGVSKTNMKNHVNLLAFTVNVMNLEDTDAESEAKHAISLFLDSLTKKSVIRITEKTTEKIANDLLNAIRIHKPKLDIPDDELRIWDAIENIPEFADVPKSKIENVITTLSKKIRILYNKDADEVEFKQILRSIVDNLLENTQWEKDDQKKELLTQTIYNRVARPKGAVEERILWEAIKELPGSSKINKSNMDSLIKEIAIKINGINKKVDGNGSSNTELQDRVSSYLQVILMKIGSKIDDEQKNKFIQTVCNQTKTASVHSKEEERLIWTAIKKIPEFNDIPRHEIRDMVKSLAIKLHGYTIGTSNSDQTYRIESFLNKISTKYNQPLNSYTKNKFTTKIVRHFKVSPEEQQIWDIIENTPDLATIPRSEISPMVKKVTNEIQKLKSEEDIEDIQVEIEKRISNFFKILLHKYDLKSSITREEKILPDKIDQAPELKEIPKEDIKKPVKMLDNNIKRTDDEALNDIENEINTVFHEVATKSANTLDSKKIHKLTKDFSSQLVQQNTDMDESVKQRLDTSVPNFNKTSIRVKDENSIVRLKNNILNNSKFDVEVEKQKSIEAEVALSIFKENPKFSNIPENKIKDIIKKHIDQYYDSRSSEVIEKLLQNIATTTGCDIESQDTEDFINNFRTKLYDKMLVIKKENIVFDKLKYALGEINHMNSQDEIKEMVALLHLLDEKEITKDIELEKINIVQKIIRLYSDKSEDIIDLKLRNKLTQEILNDLYLVSASMLKEEMLWDVINSTPELKNISKDKIEEILVTLSKLLPDICVDGADCETTSEIQDRIGCLLRDIARITDTKINSHIKNKVANTYIQTAVNQARVVANTELLWNIIKSMPQLASIVETDIKYLVKKLALDISKANVTNLKKHQLVNDFIKNVFIKISSNFDEQIQKELSEHFFNELLPKSKALDNEIIIWDILNNTSGLANIKNDEARDVIRKLASELPDIESEGTTEDVLQVMQDLLTEVSAKTVIKLNSEQKAKIAKEYATKQEHNFKSDENSLLKFTDKSNNTYKLNGSELANPFKIHGNASNVPEEKIIIGKISNDNKTKQTIHPKRPQQVDVFKPNNLRNSTDSNAFLEKNQHYYRSHSEKDGGFTDKIKERFVLDRIISTFGYINEDIVDLIWKLAADLQFFKTNDSNKNVLLEKQELIRSFLQNVSAKYDSKIDIETYSNLTHQFMRFLLCECNESGQIHANQNNSTIKNYGIKSNLTNNERQIYIEKENNANGFTNKGNLRGKSELEKSIFIKLLKTFGHIDGSDVHDLIKNLIAEIYSLKNITTSNNFDMVKNEVIQKFVRDIAARNNFQIYNDDMNKLLDDINNLFGNQTNKNVLYVNVNDKILDGKMQLIWKKTKTIFDDINEVEVKDYIKQVATDLIILDEKGSTESLQIEKEIILTKFINNVAVLSDKSIKIQEQNKLAADFISYLKCKCAKSDENNNDLKTSKSLESNDMMKWSEGVQTDSHLEPSYRKNERVNDLLRPSPIVTDSSMINSNTLKEKVTHDIVGAEKESSNQKYLLGYSKKNCRCKSIIDPEQKQKYRDEDNRSSPENAELNNSVTSKTLNIQVKEESKKPNYVGNGYQYKDEADGALPSKLDTKYNQGNIDIPKFINKCPNRQERSKALALSTKENKDTLFKDNCYPERNSNSSQIKQSETPTVNKIWNIINNIRSRPDTSDSITTKLRPLIETLALTIDDQDSLQAQKEIKKFVNSISKILSDKTALRVIENSLLHLVPTHDTSHIRKKWEKHNIIEDRSKKLQETIDHFTELVERNNDNIITKQRKLSQIKRLAEKINEIDFQPDLEDEEKQAMIQDEISQFARKISIGHTNDSKELVEKTLNEEWKKIGKHNVSKKQYAETYQIPEHTTNLEAAIQNWLRKFKVDVEIMENLPVVLASDFIEWQNESDPDKKSKSTLQRILIDRIRDALDADETDSILKHVDSLINIINKIKVDKRININKYTPTTSTTLSEKTMDPLCQKIQNWVESLPLRQNSSQEKRNIDETKKNLIKRLSQKIVALNMNPEIFNDDFLYGITLDDEIDEVLGTIPSNQELYGSKSEHKENIIITLKEIQQKTKDSIAGKKYRIDLRTNIAGMLPSNENLSMQQQAVFEIFINDLVDIFIQSTYEYSRIEDRNKEVSNFIKSDKNAKTVYLKASSEKTCDINEFVKEIVKTLEKVPLPNETAIKSEVEQIKTKNTIADLVKNLPFDHNFDMIDFVKLNKMLYVLVNRLHAIEAENASPHPSSCYSLIKTEISKWLRKLPIKNKDDTNDIAEQIAKRIKDTELARKPKKQRTEDQYKSTLAEQDKALLEKIKQRVQTNNYGRLSTDSTDVIYENVRNDPPLPDDENYPAQDQQTQTTSSSQTPTCICPKPKENPTARPQPAKNRTAAHRTTSPTRPEFLPESIHFRKPPCSRDPAHLRQPCDPENPICGSWPSPCFPVASKKTLTRKQSPGVQSNRPRDQEPKKPRAKTAANKGRNSPAGLNIRAEFGNENTEDKPKGISRRHREEVVDCRTTKGSAECTCPIGQFNKHKIYRYEGTFRCDGACPFPKFLYFPE